MLTQVLLVLSLLQSGVFEETVYFSGMVRIISTYTGHVSYGTVVSSTLRWYDDAGKCTREVVKFLIHVDPSQDGLLKNGDLRGTGAPIYGWVTIGVRADGAETCTIDGWWRLEIYPADNQFRNRFKEIAPIDDRRFKRVDVVDQLDHTLVLLEDFPSGSGSGAMEDMRPIR